MLNTLSVAQVRDIDRLAAEQYGLPGIVLMENAGRSCVLTLLAHGCRGPVVVCCGKGNNGGDGFVIARHLEATGVKVQVLLFADPATLKGDALANYQVAQRSQIPITVLTNPTAAEIDQHLAEAKWLVDALLGTGAKGNPQPPISLAIERMNESTAATFAVDVPSGLDADTGEPAEPTIIADLTCTFVARKTGFDDPRAQAHLGTVEVAEIGLPRKLLAEQGVTIPII